MNYREAVTEKITGQSDELERRRKLWQGIATAYKEGSTTKVKSTVAEQIEDMRVEFDKLLGQLREKL